jgi:hypothetical protein
MTLKMVADPLFSSQEMYLLTTTILPLSKRVGSLLLLTEVSLDLDGVGL